MEKTDIRENSFCIVLKALNHGLRVEYDDNKFLTIKEGQLFNCIKNRKTGAVNVFLLDSLVEFIAICRSLSEDSLKNLEGDINLVRFAANFLFNEGEELEGEN